MFKKLWKDSRRKLTVGESRALDEIKEQGGGDPGECLNYAAVSLSMARAEQDRLREIIGRLRHTVQRLQFPNIYPPNCPAGEEEIAREIYAVAAHVVELMRREGMEENYEVTFNSMAEIAGFGEPLCVSSDERLTEAAWQSDD